MISMIAWLKRQVNRLNRFSYKVVIIIAIIIDHFGHNIRYLRMLLAGIIVGSKTQ